MKSLTSVSRPVAREATETAPSTLLTCRFQQIRVACISATFFLVWLYVAQFLNKAHSSPLLILPLFAWLLPDYGMNWGDFPGVIGPDDSVSSFWWYAVPLTFGTFFLIALPDVLRVLRSLWQKLLHAHFAKVRISPSLRADCRAEADCLTQQRAQQRRKMRRKQQ